MSTDLSLERRTGPAITLDEWKAAIAGHADLRLRTAPYVGRNPKTGASIQIPVIDGEVEMLHDGAWRAFLRWRRGRLQGAWRENIDDPDNPLRIKIAALARALGADIILDPDGIVLPW